MIKIEKLTKKQITKQTEVRDYWINLALNSGDEMNKKDLKEGIY